MATDLTNEAKAGYAAEDDAPNPHMWSSAAWMGFAAGRTLRRQGRTEPRKARMSRGYSVLIETAGDTDIKVTFLGSQLDIIRAERL